ncbi:MAG: hypothetical protein Q9195_009097 [Heterodermia aff. obscurata]
MILQPFFERNYASFEKLIKTVQKHVEKESFAVITKRFKSSYFTRKKIKCVIKCDREKTFKPKKEITKAVREEREKREKRKDTVAAELTWFQKLRALKTEFEVDKIKKREKADKIKTQLQTIENENIVIKRNVRFMLSEKRMRSDKIVLSNDSEVFEHEVFEHEVFEQKTGAHSENPMKLNSNTNSDYNTNPNDGEITGDLNMV